MFQVTKEDLLNNEKFTTSHLATVKKISTQQVLELGLRNLNPPYKGHPAVDPIQFAALNGAFAAGAQALAEYFMTFCEEGSQTKEPESYYEPLEPDDDDDEE